MIKTNVLIIGGKANPSKRVVIQNTARIKSVSKVLFTFDNEKDIIETWQGLHSVDAEAGQKLSGLLLKQKSSVHVDLSDTINRRLNGHVDLVLKL